MCTCIHLQTKDSYFGRNLDLEYRFQEKVIVTPRNYEFKLKKEATFRTKYAMIGMAAVVENYPLYAEACNEKGLAIAGLYFPDNACYRKEEKEKINITPFELIPWILGNFTNLDEVSEVIHTINLIDIPFSKEIPLTPLHWMISDKNESIVIEQMQDGLKVYPNPIGVLTNNPPFPYQLTNLNNYINLTPHFPKNRFSNKIAIEAYGNGMGAIGLPGDSSPVSRLIRASFHKLNSICGETEEESVSQFFHLLDTVAMVRGSVITNDEKYDITNYSCCMNITKGIYYYKTYHNNQITAVNLNEKNMNDSQLDVYTLIEKQQIYDMN